MRPIKSGIIVEPYFDANKVGSLFLPEPFKDPEPQQGTVTHVGETVQYLRVGDYVLFHPYRSEPIPKTGLIALRERDVVARVEGDTFSTIRGEVTVLPDWDSKYSYKGLIYAPKHHLEEFQPVLQGWVYKSDYLEFPVGTKVMIPPGAGSQVVWIDTVYYLIDPLDIPAIINAPDR